MGIVFFPNNHCNQGVHPYFRTKMWLYISTCMKLGCACVCVWCYGFSKSRWDVWYIWWCILVIRKKCIGSHFCGAMVWRDYLTSVALVRTKENVNGLPGMWSGSFFPRQPQRPALPHWGEQEVPFPITFSFGNSFYYQIEFLLSRSHPRSHPFRSIYDFLLMKYAYFDAVNMRIS